MRKVVQVSINSTSEEVLRLLIQEQLMGSSGFH